MIFKYQRPAQEGTKDVPSSTIFESTHVVSGVDRYEFGHFKEVDDYGNRDMYVTYHLEKDVDDRSHSVTISPGYSAFMMNDEGQTIERIR